MERNNKTYGDDKKVRNRVKWFWVGFFGAIIFAALLSLTLNYLYEKGREKLKSTANETLLPISPSVKKNAKKLVEEAVQNLEKRKSEIIRKALERSMPQIEKLTAEYKEKLSRKVQKLINLYFTLQVYPSEPEFVDWVYSLKTQYLLLFYKGKSLLEETQYLLLPYKGKSLLEGSTEAERYFVENFERILLKPDRLRKFTDQALSTAVKKLCSEYASAVEEVFRTNLREVIREELTEQIDPSLVPESEIERVVQQTAEEMLKSMPSDLRHAVSGVAGFGAAALVYKAIVQKLVVEESLRVATSLAAKLVAKLSAKEGASALLKALGGAATGAALCAWGGPIGAAICGAAAGIATWIGVDYAVNKVDYYLNREDLRRELHASLNRLEKKLAENLTENYSRCFDEVARTFVEKIKKGLTLKELSTF